jgi:hypothetical protein
MLSNMNPFQQAHFQSCLFVTELFIFQKIHTSSIFIVFPGLVMVSGIKIAAAYT